MSANAIRRPNSVPTDSIKTSAPPNVSMERPSSRAQGAKAGAGAHGADRGRNGVARKRN